MKTLPGAEGIYLQYLRKSFLNLVSYSQMLGWLLMFVFEDLDQQFSVGVRICLLGRDAIFSKKNKKVSFYFRQWKQIMFLYTYVNPISLGDIWPCLENFLLLTTDGEVLLASKGCC